MLATAAPKLKAEVDAELGVRVTYDPHRRVIGISAGPCSTERVGGAFTSPSTPTMLKGKVQLKTA